MYVTFNKHNFYLLSKKKQKTKKQKQNVGLRKKRFATFKLTILDETNFCFSK